MSSLREALSSTQSQLLETEATLYQTVSIYSMPHSLGHETWQLMCVM